MPDAPGERSGAAPVGSSRAEPDGPIPLEALKTAARAIGDELAVAECFTRAGYQLGYIRFLPRARRDSRMIVHDDQDVVCLVLAGRGRLKRGRRTVALEPGLVCRVPAGTRHDFAASGEPLELLYTTIRVRPEEPDS